MKRWKFGGRASLGCVGLLLGAFPLSGCGDARLSFLLATAGERGSDDAGSGFSTSEPSGADETRDAGEGSTEGVAGQTDTGAVLGDASVPSVAPEPELSLNGAPLYSDYVRLTHQQWENSVVDTLRLSEPTGQLAVLSQDPPARYSNSEAALFIGGTLVAEYQLAAETVAQRIIDDPAALEKVSATRDPATFIAEVGRRFYRRPLTSGEQATYLAVYETGASLAEPEQDTFAAGARLLLETWMQAPSFLYRVEHSEGLLDGYELATRLAYLLTDSAPSDALLDAAEAGELDAASGAAHAAEQLLASPRAALVFRRFHDETFLLSHLSALEIDATWGLAQNLNEQLIEASHLFFDRLLREQLGLRELLLSQVGYINAELAALYGVPAPRDGAFEAITLSPSRRGMFAQLPFLMLGSVGDTPNTFRRGVTFTQYVLCQAEFSPPAVVPPPPVDDGVTTNRQRSSAMVSSPTCQACHHLIDPFGFAFENFDGLGRERTTDNGLPVDTTGAYPFAGNPPFADSTELMAILSESPLAHGCYAKQLAEFGLSRSLATTDTALVTELQTLSLTRNDSLAVLVTALVSSETFRSAGVSQ